MDWTIRAWNPAAEQLFGYSEAEVIGQRFDEILVPPEDLTNVSDDMRRIASGETVRSETERLHKNGQRMQVERSISAIHDVSQEYTGFVATYSDISARKASEAHIQTLLQEVNHRSKNLLAIVQVIARQTGRMYEGPDFFAVFNKRLESLTSNQDILINSQGSHVDLETLAHKQFAHLIDPADPRVTISGPTVHTNESASQAVGMAIFELVTNAAKYGGLSQETGSVALSWAITEQVAPNIEISWVETGGPPVTAPTRKGFGSQVTGPILESMTSGKTHRDYDPNGLRWYLSAPLARLTE
ncbi:PAS domain S-box protein [Oceaniovalibus sp. ACAM 378]|uniref:PAS domain S-box protein n=1 Tax=Oceaniovalibus sp. ACAM 378 TaxID=2599923 RepID=UPI0016523387|nr:PAS domain S-box protein [Oceaniovalibus sp. ACAM 378]